MIRVRTVGRAPLPCIPRIKQIQVELQPSEWTLPEDYSGLLIISRGRPITREVEEADAKRHTCTCSVDVDNVDKKRHGVF